jgi:hypothetical protein
MVEKEIWVSICSKVANSIRIRFGATNAGVTNLPHLK